MQLELHGQDPRFTKYSINSSGFLEGVSHKMKMRQGILRENKYSKC